MARRSAANFRPVVHSRQPDLPLFDGSGNEIKIFGPLSSKSGLEVRRQILVGVAITIGAFDPDFLATQLLAQRLQRANLIGHSVDPCSLPGIALGHGVTPGHRHDTIERYEFLKRIARQSAVEVTANQVERIKHWPVILVIGTECQNTEHDRQHTAVVRAVGAADHGRLRTASVGSRPDGGVARAVPRLQRAADRPAEPSMGGQRTGLPAVQAPGYR